MARREDHETSTVDGAAAFERHHGEEPEDERVTEQDVDWIGPLLDELAASASHRPGCHARDFSECFC